MRKFSDANQQGHLVSKMSKGNNKLTQVKSNENHQIVWSV